MQLKMWRPKGLAIPAYALPEGYTLRSMRDGEEADWARCCIGEFGVDAPAAEHYQRRMSAMPKEHVFFACADDLPVATATARITDENEPFLHYIAVCPEHRGHRLAKPLISHVLRTLEACGLEGCFLTTDDFRIPAIHTYLSFGYCPVLWSEDAQERWEKVLAVLQLPLVAAYHPDLTAAEPITAAKQ